MAGGTGIDPFLVDAATYLAAAVVAVPLFKRLKLGSVIGYLAAGAVIGPSGLGLIEEAQSALSFAEFGVVLLLFVIGLELQPARLWRLRTEIFGLGLLQVFITGFAIALILGSLGLFSTNSAIAIGGALALSSTAFAIQILRERGDLTTPWGDRAFSVLLFQDLAIVPLLFMVSLLSPWGGGGDGISFTQVATALLAIAGLVVVGHFLLRPLFHLLAATKSDEIFTAAALLVVIGSALAMQYAGLSMALGAFLAGVLLAESEFRHQLESDIEPFRGLLLGLLFIAFGMSVSLPVILENWQTVLIGSVGLVLLKLGTLAVLCRLFGSTWSESWRIGAVLGQGGEFGFVLFTVAMGVGLLTQTESRLLTAVVIATMALTPVVVALADRFASSKSADDMSGIDHFDKAEATSVIVVGFGRFGQVIGRILRLRGYDVTLIDSSPERIRVAQTFGNKVFFGDVRRGDILKIAGAEDARAIFLCADDHESVVQATRTLREKFPHVLLFARAHDRVAKVELRKAGADVVIREMFESSVAMAREALERFGDGDVIEEVLEEFRRRDAELLRLQSEFGAVQGYEKMREEFDLRDEKTN